MTVLERIKETARIKKNISLTVLEQDLGYSNGSLAKAKDIPSSRILEISIYLGVTMEYLMTGKENNISEDLADELVEIMYADEEIKKCFTKILSMPKDKQEHIISIINTFK